MSGLFDLDKGGKEHSLSSTANSERLQIGISRIHPKTFQKMIETVDSALLNLKPSESSQLTWTMCGALLGYNSAEPTKSTNHLWEKSFEAFRGHVKSSNIFVGCLVRWRIAELAHSKGDTWLTMKQETGGIDIDTGDPITRACYWINNNFKVKNSKPSLKELSSKFRSIQI